MNPAQVWDVLFVLVSTSFSRMSDLRETDPPRLFLPGYSCWSSEHFELSTNLPGQAISTFQSVNCLLWFMEKFINRLLVQEDGPVDGNHAILTPGPSRVAPLLTPVSEQVRGRAGRGKVWGQQQESTNERVCLHLLPIDAALQTLCFSLPYESVNHSQIWLLIIACGCQTWVRVGNDDDDNTNDNITYLVLKW